MAGGQPDLQPEHVAMAAATELKGFAGFGSFMQDTSVEVLIRQPHAAYTPPALPPKVTAIHDGIQALTVGTGSTAFVITCFNLLFRRVRDCVSVSQCLTLHTPGLPLIPSDVTGSRVWQSRQGTVSAGHGVLLPEPWCIRGRITHCLRGCGTYSNPLSNGSVLTLSPLSNGSVLTRSPLPNDSC